MASSNFPGTGQVLGSGSNEGGRPIGVGRKVLSYGDQVKAAILDTLNEIKQISEPIPPERIFFVTEDRNAGSNFERQSTLLQAGVVSEYTHHGLALLFILRMILDDGFKLSKTLFNDPDERLEIEDMVISINKKIQSYNFSPHDLIAAFANQEYDSYKTFPITQDHLDMDVFYPYGKNEDKNFRDQAKIEEEQLSADLWKIKGERQDVDLWNVDRIREAVEAKNFRSIDFN